MPVDPAHRQDFLHGVRGGDVEKVQYYLDLYPELVHERLAYGWTPLYFACGEGHLAVARLLLRRGADPNAQGDDGETPLHVAAHRGHPDLCRELVARGADLEAETRDGLTPLAAAAQQATDAGAPQAIVVRELLDLGAKNSLPWD
jgi:ankyrin repeat protein